MLKVIVVEDATLTRKGLIMTTNWEKNDCELISEAANGLDGRDLILRLKPDIAITDIRLPGISGLDMIEQVRRHVRTKFIIISGYSEFEYAHRAMSLNVIDYLIKPVKDHDLDNALVRAGSAIQEQIKLERLQSEIRKIENSPIMLFKEHLFYGHTTKSSYANRVIEYIGRNYARPITVKDIADSLSMSESHLSHIFKEEISLTVIDYLAYYRIKQACRLLTDHTIKIYEIADRVGYHDQRYFSVVFKRLVGMTPKEFRNASSPRG